MHLSNVSLDWLLLQTDDRQFGCYARVPFIWSVGLVDILDRLVPSLIGLLALISSPDEMYNPTNRDLEEIVFPRLTRGASYLLRLNF